MHHDRRTTTQPIETVVESSASIEGTFVPRRYEPNYAYPLLVLLHSRGGDEQQLLRALPSMSWRNYVGLGLRGPRAILKEGEPSGYDWGPAFRHPSRKPQAESAEIQAAEVIRRVMDGGQPDDLDRIEHGLFAAVKRARRTLHIHSERIFLVGSGEGAAVAYRLGLTYPERFAGVVAINGWIPSEFRPLARWEACRPLKILAVHGVGNPFTTLEDLDRDMRVLRNAGLDVTRQVHDAAHRLPKAVLSEIDAWLIHQCTSQGRTSDRSC